MKQCPQCNTENPQEANFCRKCGYKIYDKKKVVNESIPEPKVDHRPFHIRYPEYNLIPYSEHAASFVFNQPDYIEREYLPHGKNQFLWIVKDGKFGITKFRYEDHWYGDEVYTDRIIKCRYDCIEKADAYFICHKDSQVIYIDLQGNILK